MATESYIVVALPHSRAADAEFHVSLFVAPELTPASRILLQFVQDRL